MLYNPHFKKIFHIIKIFVEDSTLFVIFACINVLLFMIEIVTLWIIILFTSFLEAQNLRVDEVLEGMSKGTQKGLAIEFPEVSEDFLLKEFKDWVDKFKGKTKIDKKNNEVFSDDAFIKEVSANTIDIYAKVINKGKAQKLVMFVDLGGAFLNTQMHADKYKIMEGHLLEFGKSVIKNDLKNRLEQAEKVLKNYEKEKKDLEQEQSKSLKNIEEAKNTIKKEEENIEANKKKQAEKEKQIMEQTKIVENLRNEYQKVKK